MFVTQGFKYLINLEFTCILLPHHGENSIFILELFGIARQLLENAMTESNLI